jgi:sodium pump decarboxylase gamma subunit
MLANLLDTTVDQYISKGTALLYALVGFVVVLIGIAFLILVVWAVGKIMSAKNGTQVKSQKQEKPKAVETVKESIAVADADEISEETLAVITAALMAYYQQTNPKCEFTVKRIKRI